MIFCGNDCNNCGVFKNEKSYKYGIMFYCFKIGNMWNWDKIRKSMRLKTTVKVFLSIAVVNNSEDTYSNLKNALLLERTPDEQEMISGDIQNKITQFLQ